MASMMSDVLESRHGGLGALDGVQVARRRQDRHLAGLQAMRGSSASLPRWWRACGLATTNRRPIMNRGFASVVVVGVDQVHEGRHASATSPSGSPARRASRRFAAAAPRVVWPPNTASCHGEVDNDLVSIGRAPDLCPLHSSTTPTSPIAAPRRSASARGRNPVMIQTHAG